jgi:lathosterol oxidase
MISTNSIQNFIVINGILVSVSVIQYNCIQYINYLVENNKLIELFIIFFIFISRNYLLLNFIDYGTKHKLSISNDILPREEYKHEFDYYVINTTAIESITHIMIKTNINFNTTNNLYMELLYFIPISFCFELVFDLIHYLAHRLLHNKYLYKYLHKTHHKFKHPTSVIAFYQDPIDLIITNSIPTITSLLIIKNISYMQFNLIITYKLFIEISGHIGKKIYPTCSFSQFIWLPKFLNIELYTEDHDLHHSLNNCNYSKRFSLWDKLFGTYKSSRITI